MLCDMLLGKTKKQNLFVPQALKEDIRTTRQGFIYIGKKMYIKVGYVGVYTFM